MVGLQRTMDQTNSSRSDDILAGVAIFIVAFVGIITNGMSAVTIFKMEHLRNAFGYSCASHAFGNLGVLFIFAFWAAPLLILQHHMIQRIHGYKFISDTAGQLTILFYYAGIYTNILITVNRCFVITWPVLYQKYFNTSVTIRWIILIWSISFAQSCIYQLPECHFSFDSRSYTWNYSDSICGYVISTFFECSLNSFAVVFIILMDSFILYKLRSMHKAFHVSGANMISTFEQQQRRNREIRFFLQACCSESLYLMAVANFYGFVQLATSKWAVFALTTMVWVLFHTVDGIILVAFNRNVWDCCGKRKKKTTDRKKAEKINVTDFKARPRAPKRVVPLTMVSGGTLVRNVVGPAISQLRLDTIVDSNNKKLIMHKILTSSC